MEKEDLMEILPVRGLPATILIFEGPPSSGKTTLRRRLMYAFDNIVTIEKFTGYKWVCMKLRGCPDDYLLDILSIESVLSAHFNCILFYVYSQPHFIYRDRVINPEEGDVLAERAKRSLDDLKKICDLYSEYYSASKFRNKISIPTYYRSSDEIYRDAYDYLVTYAKLVRLGAWNCLDI